MLARTEICGWPKILEVPSQSIISGFIEIAILPPLDKLVPASKKVVPSEMGAVKVILRYVGCENNLAVFALR